MYLHIFTFQISISVHLSSLLPLAQSLTHRMSWQSYVDDQLVATTYVTRAAIAGHDGNLWAASGGFSPTQAELKNIATNLGGDVGSTFAMTGVTVAGTKYMYLSSNERVLRAKKGTSGVHIMKTVQAIIVAQYEEPIVAEQCATTTEKLGEYLMSVGY